jgi:probable H4MPT-linked C1 transfer pathway protein
MKPNDGLVIGIDIGGANLKYAIPNRHVEPLAASRSVEPRGVLGETRSRFFPMWRRPESLASELDEDLSQLAGGRQISALVVTMTGELADCFLDRQEGVEHIVSQACLAAKRLKVGEVVFYGVDGRFHERQEAVREVDRVAAANWHALGSFIGQSCCLNGLVIDIGSTTTDVIPLAGGLVATEAKTDFERLAEGSLVYIGGRRTPVAALVDQLAHRGQAVSVMKEVFATMDDVRLVLKHVAEDEHDTDTADGRSRTIAMAINRLARMIGLDRRQLTTDDAVALASQVHTVARSRIGEAAARLQRGTGPPAVNVISGHASDLVHLPPGAPVIVLSERLGGPISRSAPAFAVAALFLSQRTGWDLRCDALSKSVEA